MAMVERNMAKGAGSFCSQIRLGHCRLERDAIFMSNKLYVLQIISFPSYFLHSFPFWFWVVVRIAHTGTARKRGEVCTMKSSGF